MIATLDDLSIVKVDFTIPETWLGAVKAGLGIEARTDAGSRIYGAFIWTGQQEIETSELLRSW